MKRKIDRAWIFPIVVLLLGWWHRLDVQKGVEECGDRWLMTGYFVLLAAVVCIVLYLGYLLLGALPLERVYVFTGLLLGLFFMFVLPPLTAPDEISHYVSAYRLSSSMLAQRDTDR